MTRSSRCRGKYSCQPHWSILCWSAFSRFSYQSAAGGTEYTQTVTIKVGQTVTWENPTLAPHVIMIGGGLDPSAVTFARPKPRSGTDYSSGFAEVGVVDHGCGLAIRMVGEEERDECWYGA